MLRIFYVSIFILELDPIGIKINFLEHRLVTEGAAATSVMVAKDNLSTNLGKNIICLICGGNIESKLFTKIIP